MSNKYPEATLGIAIVENAVRWAEHMLLEAISNNRDYISEERRKYIYDAVTCLEDFGRQRLESDHKMLLDEIERQKKEKKR